MAMHFAQGYLVWEYDFYVQRHLCTKLVRRLCTKCDVCVQIFL